MESANENNNYSATVYINHYEWFTDEHLKVYKNGQKFKFAYHKEVQKFYEYRPNQVSNQIPNQLKQKSNNQLENPAHINLEIDDKINDIDSRSTTSNESSASIKISRPSSFCDISRDQNLHQMSSQSNSTSSKSSSSQIEIEASNEPKLVIKCPKSNQPLTNQSEHFLKEIRDFKFSNTQHQDFTTNEPKKPQLFKQNSNPLLTSSFLHQQLDNFREQMRTPSDIDTSQNDSSSNQWDFE